MTNPKGLSLWVNSKIDKKGGAEFKSNRAFARRFKMDNKTVARLLEDRPVEKTTLQKLADGQGADLADFLKMIAEFENNPDDAAALESEIEARLPTLKEEQQQNVLALIKSFQEQNKNNGAT